MSTTLETIRENYDSITQRMGEACARAVRDVQSVQLIAVVKYAEFQWVQALAELGLTEFGESRPQQLVERAPQFSEKIHWHLIGQLQRNKIRKVLPAVALIHSIDSEKLLLGVNRVAEEMALRPSALLQVNVAGEDSKGGFSPQELKRLWPSLVDYPHVDIRGLMTMAPGSRDLDDARRTFAGLRELREELRAMNARPESALAELSMGMSGDFEIAIEEGATLIRIGSGLFRGLTTD